LAAFKDHTLARRRTGRGGRGASRDGGRRRGGGYARRASSVYRDVIQQPPPPMLVQPPPILKQPPPPPPANNNPFQALACQYVDNGEIPLDLDDAATGGFDADLAAEGNNKTNSASTH
jgi:hypothetical protein